MRILPQPLPSTYQAPKRTVDVDLIQFASEYGLTVEEVWEFLGAIPGSRYLSMPIAEYYNHKRYFGELN